ncbi:hypothetical protein GJAV_G00009150 [Gymnothorax javanicus]|nr:hypothetical protein GJAV_G00009150 [Gymnothorax javanicus]
MVPVNDMLYEDQTFSCSPWLVPHGLQGRSASFSGVICHREASQPYLSNWSGGREQCASPQNWRPQPLQSVTALVSPRIHGRPSRPISTLQEVTSEAEEEDTEKSQEVATVPFQSSQPAPRQRSFSCTQHALQRRSSGAQLDLSIASAGKPTNEHIEIMMSNTEVPSQSEVKTSSDFPSMVQSDSRAGSSMNCKQEQQGEKISSLLADSVTSAQTAL